jgi:hypothetical protein
MNRTHPVAAVFGSVQYGIGRTHRNKMNFSCHFRDSLSNKRPITAIGHTRQYRQALARLLLQGIIINLGSAVCPLVKEYCKDSETVLRLRSDWKFRWLCW